MLTIQWLILNCGCSIEKAIIQVTDSLASKVTKLATQREISHDEDLELVKYNREVCPWRSNQNLLKHHCVMSFGKELTE